MVFVIDFFTNNISRLLDMNNRAGIYLLKVNKRNTRTRRQICSKITIKTPERLSHLVLVIILLTLNM